MCYVVGIYQTQPLTGLHILLILHILHILYYLHILHILHILHNLHILHILYYSKSIKILILHPPEHWTYISIGLNSEGGPSKLRVKNLSHKDCMNPERKIMRFKKILSLYLEKMAEISTQFGRRPWGEIENIWPSYLCIISPGWSREREGYFLLPQKN